MYNPALLKPLADARIEDLRSARGTSIRPFRSHEDGMRRAAPRWALLTRAGVGRLVFADSSRATWGPRS